MQPTSGHELGFERVGPYRVQRLIGEGAAGWVFEVEREGRGCALKLLKPWAVDPVQGDELRLRFLREIEILERCSHPALLSVLDSGDAPRVERTDGSSFEAPLYYTMPLLRRNLADRIAPGTGECQPLSESDALECFVPLLGALAELHQHGIVHRDIKPANILLADDGRAFLADLGIAHDQEASTTRTGVLLGTPEWMSPEQALGRHPVDPRSDLFSLGLTLYFALSGVRPYTSIAELETPDAERVHRHLLICASRSSELGLRFLDPRISRWTTAIRLPFQEVIRKATRIAREARYADAMSLREDLARAFAAPRATLEPERIARVGEYSIRALVAESAASLTFEVEEGGDSVRLELLGSLEGAGSAILERDATALSRALELQSGLGPAVLPVIRSLSRPGVETLDGQTTEAPFAIVTPALRSLAEDRRGRAIGPDAASVIEGTLPVLDALQRLHRRGLVHGRLSPDALCCDAAGALYLGRMRVPEIDRRHGPTLARVEESYWDAPEVRAGSAEPASDVFSLGLVLCWMLTGRLPPAAVPEFAERDHDQWAEWLATRWDAARSSSRSDSRSAQDSSSDAGALGLELDGSFAGFPGVPAEVRGVIEAATRLNAELRPQSAGALARELRRSLRRMRRLQGERHEFVWSLGALGATAVAVSAVAAILFLNRPSPSSSPSSSSSVREEAEMRVDPTVEPSDLAEAVSSQREIEREIERDATRDGPREAGTPEISEEKPPAVGAGERARQAGSVPDPTPRLREEPRALSTTVAELPERAGSRAEGGTRPEETEVSIGTEPPSDRDSVRKIVDQYALALGECDPAVLAAMADPAMLEFLEVAGCGPPIEPEYETLRCSERACAVDVRDPEGGRWRLELEREPSGWRVIRQVDAD